jgi:hypothetical protein
MKMYTKENNSNHISPGIRFESRILRVCCPLSVQGAFAFPSAATRLFHGSDGLVRVRIDTLSQSFALRTHLQTHVQAFSNNQPHSPSTNSEQRCLPNVTRTYFLSELTMGSNLTADIRSGPKPRASTRKGISYKVIFSFSDQRKHPGFSF